HAPALDAEAAVVGVEAVAAPVAVGVIGVGGELHENLRVGTWPRRADDKEQLRLGRLAAGWRDLHASRVIAGLPIRGNFQLQRDRPATAVRGRVRRNGVRPAGRIILLPDHYPFGADAGDLQAVLRCLGRDVEGDLLAGRVAEFVRIAL